MKKEHKIQSTLFDLEIDIKEAAYVLNMSRLCVVKLLEAGAIPFKKVGSSRRVLMEDVLVYANRQKEAHKEHLQFLVQQA